VKKSRPESGGSIEPIPCVVEPSTVVRYQGHGPTRSITPLIDATTCGAQELSASLYRLPPRGSRMRDIHAEEEMSYILGGRHTSPSTVKSFRSRQGCSFSSPRTAGIKALTWETRICATCASSLHPPLGTAEIHYGALDSTPPSRTIRDVSEVPRLSGAWGPGFHNGTQGLVGGSVDRGTRFFAGLKTVSGGEVIRGPGRTGAVQMGGQATVARPPSDPGQSGECVFAGRGEHRGKGVEE
jgi:hypothetical protein